MAVVATESLGLGNHYQGKAEPKAFIAELYYVKEKNQR